MPRLELSFHLIDFALEMLKFVERAVYGVAFEFVVDA